MSLLPGRFYLDDFFNDFEPEKKVMNMNCDIYEKEDKHYIKRERYFGSFKREFYIGDVNHKDIKAEFKDGTLKVIVPESPKKDNKKLIDIE